MTVEGSMNVLKHYGVIEGLMGRTSKEAGTFFGDAFEMIRSTTGGFLELLVDLKDKVMPGQKVAIQRNSFGDIVAEYTASVVGEVATIARDALSEPGARVLETLNDSTDPASLAIQDLDPTAGKVVNTADDAQTIFFDHLRQDRFGVT